MGTRSDDTAEGETPVAVEISLCRGESSDQWIARDEDSGVTSQGPTRQAALENLDEALAGYHGAGDAPDADRLRELGIDPAENHSGRIDGADQFE